MNYKNSLSFHILAKKYHMSEFQSKEELYFSWYCNDLFNAGYIKGFTPQPQTFKLFEAKGITHIQKLKTKDKIRELSLIQAHEYTPDFMLHWTKKAKGIFYRPIESDNDDDYYYHPGEIPFLSSPTEPTCSHIEIKPDFNFQNKTDKASISVKWVYDKYGIFVDIVKINQLFKNTFVPERYFLTDKGGQQRQISKYTPKKLSEYVYEKERVIKMKKTMSLL